MECCLLIKNGTVVNDDYFFKSDVLICNEIIHKMGENLSYDSSNCEILDATDCYVMPGGIDPHTHFQMPFMGQVAVDDFYYGTRAALAGGTTTIIDFALSSKNLSPIKAYNQWREWADSKVCCDYGLSMAITNWNKNVCDEMEKLTKPQYGINSFKFFLAYKNLLMVEDDEFFQGLKQCAKIGALARVHAENGSVIAEKQKELLKQGVTGPEGHSQSRPEKLEAEATNRACILANEANCPLYVVHVMSSEAAQVIANHRLNGQVIFGESIAAALALDGSHYFNKNWYHAAGFVLSPPLSLNQKTPEILMKYLASGQLQLTGTDNCTFTCAQKLAGMNDFTKIPNGVNGVEDRLSVVWEKGVVNGIIDITRFVAITSTIAAKIFNIYPKKGRIQIGSDADIIIWDGKKKRIISAKTHHQAVDYNIFEGMKVHGVAKATIFKGKIVWLNGKFTSNLRAGIGQFLSLKANCNYVFETTRVAEKNSQPIRIDRKTN